MSEKHKVRKSNRLTDVTPRLSMEEKRIERVKKSNPREGYRNYSKRNYPYILIIFTDAVATFIAICILTVLLSFPALGVYSFVRWADLLTKSIAFLILILVLCHILFRAPVKRILFIINLKKICKKRGFELLVYKNLMRSILVPHNEVAFSVNTDDALYEIMFFPSYRKMVTLCFEKKTK